MNDERKEFINYLKTLILSNPNKKMDYRVIYSLLVSYNLPMNASLYDDLRGMFPSIIASFKQVGDPRTTYKQTNDYLLIQNGRLNNNEVKVYIPTSKETLERTLMIIAKSLQQLNINYEVRVTSNMRNDNVVIKVNSLEDAQMLENVITLNRLNGSVGVNPFLPTVNGVGMSMDNSFSYTTVLSTLLATFIDEHPSLDDLTLANFNDFVMKKLAELKTKPLDSKGQDLLDVYKLISLTTKEQFTIKDFYDFAREKEADKYDYRATRITAPEFYLEQALQETQKKYPFNLERALMEYINKGDAMFFTNNQSARTGLSKYVSQENVLNLIKERLMAEGISVSDDIGQMIKAYLGVLKRHNPHLEEFGIICQAYLSTYAKYNYEQAHNALVKFIQTGFTRGFTDAEGYRTMLEKRVGGRNIFQIIHAALPEIENLQNIEEVVEIMEKQFMQGKHR